ncbi:hypothetical protein KJ678_04375 [Patescibacteria group bacterium]|nr:hypothetical protein [Patescibacteria group bacterium]
MKFARVVLFSTVLTILLFAVFNLAVSYAEESVLLDKYNSIREQIVEVERVIGDLLNTEKNLQVEIDYVNSKIGWAELKIKESEVKIAQKEEELVILSKEVEGFAERIYRVSEALGEQEKILEGRVRARYKSEREVSLSLFISANGLSDVINRLKYLRVAQEQDNKLLLEFKETKQNFTSQKVILEDKKKKVDALKLAVEQEKRNTELYQSELQEQKDKKARLLEVTKGDEQNYQEMLKTLREDEKAIREALGNALSDIIAGRLSGEYVSKGDVIGLQGNTGNVYPRPSGGCPTCGTHLDFMIFTCFENGYITSNCVDDPTDYIDGENGLHKPIDYKYITQEFGNTPFAQSGQAGYLFHLGIDLVAYHGAPIYAIDDGTVYYGTDRYGAHYALIKHDDDFWSAYWHIQ